MYGALKDHGYEVSVSKVRKGKRTNYGFLSGDYHGFIVRSKTYVKRLLEHVEPRLFHKWLKARLIKRALSDPSKPVYWEDFEPAYVEVKPLLRGNAKA